MTDAFLLAVLGMWERTVKDMGVGEAGVIISKRGQVFLLQGHNFVGDSVRLKNVALHFLLGHAKSQSCERASAETASGSSSDLTQLFCVSHFIANR